MQFLGNFGGSTTKTIDGATVTVSVSGILTAHLTNLTGNVVDGSWTYSGQANISIVHPEFGTSNEVVAVSGGGTIGGTLQNIQMPANSGSSVTVAPVLSSDGEIISGTAVATVPDFGSIDLTGHLNGLPPVVQFAQAEIQVAENGTVSLVLQRNFVTDVRTEVLISTTETLSATAGVDFEPLINVPKTFEPGQSTLSIELTIKPDAIIEANELVTVRVIPVRFANIGATPTVQVTIVDDDSVPTINGTTGNDVLAGGSGNQVINGAEGNDTLSGGAGNDTVNGDAGNDTIQWSPGDGNDIVDGGVGNDTVVINLAAGVANFITVLRNGDGTVQITGSGGVQFSMHVDNVETLRFEGRDGDDTISIGDLSGTDVTSTTVFVNGGAGNDSIDGSLLDKRLVATGGVGNDTLEGGAGDDRLDGGFGIDTTRGGLGNDTHVINSLSDIVQENPGEGTDTLEVAFTYSGRPVNFEIVQLAGTAAINLTGSIGADILRGNVATNTILGGVGADVIVGQGGKDLMTGGAGLDRMVLESLSDSGVTFAARDVINTFAHGDKIDVSAIDAKTTVAGDQAFVFVAAFTGVAGQLQWDLTNVSVTGVKGYLVQGDVNGDSQADFSLQIYTAPTQNLPGGPDAWNLAAWDFIL